MILIVVVDKLNVLVKYVFDNNKKVTNLGFPLLGSQVLNAGGRVFMFCLVVVHISSLR